MKYTFEKYQSCHKGLTFIGYIQIQGRDRDEALVLAQEKVGEGIKLVPIYTPYSD